MSRSNALCRFISINEKGAAAEHGNLDKKNDTADLADMLGVASASATLVLAPTITLHAILHIGKRSANQRRFCAMQLSPV